MVMKYCFIKKICVALYALLCYGVMNTQYPVCITKADKEYSATFTFYRPMLLQTIVATCLSTYSVHDFLLTTAAVGEEHMTAVATCTFAMS